MVPHFFKEMPVTETPLPQDGQANPSLSVRAQYIKDLSFENPNAPHSFMALNQKPALDINVDLKVNKLQEDTFEVILVTQVRASAENAVLFMVELAYAGVFALQHIPKERLDQVIMVDCAFILFPFVRRILADASRDGGFPPLLLDPIDFHSLYLRNRKAPKPSPEAVAQ
jgi:preprotein translocase subunit SecB